MTEKERLEEEILSYELAIAKLESTKLEAVQKLEEIIENEEK